MSTRGFVGFVADGQEKISYSHSDSYPSGVGIDVLRWLRTADHAAVRQQVKALQLVQEDDAPTPEHLERAAEYANPGVGGPVTNIVVHNYYQLLRETQGNPAAILASGLMLDSHDFPLDSLFCEWGYLVDLDGDGAFEVYKGFRKAAPTSGRWAGRWEKSDDPAAAITNEYAAVERIAVWSLAALPGDDEFLDLEKEDE